MDLSVNAVEDYECSLTKPSERERIRLVESGNEGETLLLSTSSLCEINASGLYDAPIIFLVGITDGYSLIEHTMIITL